MAKLRMIVEGRVQGVGFRWFVQRRGEALHLDGEVRNLPDGSLEVIAAGPPGTLEALRDAVAEGPSAARVAAVREFWDEPGEPARGFHITD
jgi:acylphosphatase